ncbi:HNH endonuclease [Nocardiopsis synnemataformans]|uniref:HNH endonuclease n=1 Tax=Nocardiopsis synnemataformans TaxID=61305 RepID=UPI003EBFC4E1
MGRSRGRSGRPFVRAAARLRSMPGGDVCTYCGRVIDLTLHHNDPMAWTADHIIPLDAGGDPTDPTNLQPMHRSCNSRKGTGHMPEVHDTSRPW